MAKKFNIRDSFTNILQRVRGGKKIIVNNVNVSPTQRGNLDIGKWRSAITSAEGHSQNRLRLYDLYEDILLDGYLLAAKKKRIDAVTNRKLVFVREDGEQIEEINQLTETSFFHELIEQIMEAEMWGHSLMELDWPGFNEDKKGVTYLVPRKNVKPRWGIVTKHPHDLNGLEYRKNKRIIEVGKPERLGILMAVAQYVIYKRANIGDWGEYAEIFGIPFRHAKYNNEETRLIMEAALAEAGSAGYMVSPEDASLEFLNANNTGQGQEVFRTLHEAMNTEIGLTILTNTMTSMEAKSSGYAQSKTHADAEAEVNISDRRRVTITLNEQLIPILTALGYPTQGGKWMYAKEDSLTLSQRIDMDVKVASLVPVADSYFYETYGIPRPEAGDLVSTPPRDRNQGNPGNPDDDPDGGNQANDDDDDKGGTPGKLNARAASGAGTNRLENIANFYAPHDQECECGNCFNLTEGDVPKFRRVPMKTQQAIAKAVFDGKLTSADLSEALHKIYYNRFREFARTGYGRSLSNATEWADFELQQGMKRNLSAFAAAKQRALIDELVLLRGRPRRDYDKAAAAILKRYNGQYLVAELNTIEAAAQMASKWPDFIERAELYPNLKFSTVGDDRVRAAHAELDGAVYPVNDPFWNTHTPPLGWRCRCTLIQTDDAASERAVQDIQAGFGGNPFSTKKLIQHNHPYFELPTDQLAALLEVAESFRAVIELKGVRKRAITAGKEGGNLAGSGRVTMTTADVDDILNSDSDQQGVRDSLLTVLSEMLLNSKQPDGAIGQYEVELLDLVFVFNVERRGEEFFISEMLLQ